MSGRREDETPTASNKPRPPRRGQVIPIGGAEDPDPERDGSILHEFVRLAGGKRAHIAVIPTASADPEQSGAGYKKVFEKIGADTVEVLNVEQREEANSPQAIELLQRASGIFITGGDQARLVSLLTGTLVMETVRVSNQKGSVVAGTSAGASILSAHMMVPGSWPGLQTSDASPRKGETDLVSGFGLLQDIIIDQHFSQRGRIGRLLEAFAGNPGLLGLGLDENTAAIVDDASTLTVIGCGAATVLDGRNATSNYFECQSGEIVSVFDSHIFVLGPGQRFDLATRRPLPAIEG